MSQATIQQQVSGYSDAVKGMKVFVGVEVLPSLLAFIASGVSLYLLGVSLLTVLLCLSLVIVALLLTLLMVALRLVNYMIFLAKYTNAVQTPLMRTLSGILGS